MVVRFQRPETVTFQARPMEIVSVAYKLPVRMVPFRFTRVSNGTPSSSPPVTPSAKDWMGVMLRSGFR